MSTAPSLPPAARTFFRRGDPGRFELVEATPHPLLRGSVRDYRGYREHRLDAPVRQLEVANGDVVLVIGFGPVRTRGRAGEAREHRRFLAGLWDSWVLTSWQSPLDCVQVDLTPLGARRLFGVPMDRLANRVVALEDLLGAAVARLTERLYEAASWDQRFELLDAFLAERLATGPELSPAVLWAWQQLCGSDGRCAIAPLAAEIGCSRKHLIALFRRDLGLPPKTLARILRFDRARRLIAASERMPWAELALDCGYYDQAHMNRDFRCFAGCSPTALLRARRPGGVIEAPR